MERYVEWWRKCWHCSSALLMCWKGWKGSVIRGHLCGLRRQSSSNSGAMQFTSMKNWKFYVWIQAGPVRLNVSAFPQLLSHCAWRQSESTYSMGWVTWCKLAFRYMMTCPIKVWQLDWLYAENKRGQEVMIAALAPWWWSWPAHLSLNQVEFGQFKDSK